MTEHAASVPGVGQLAERRWLTLHDAARILGVHANTLRRWSDAASIRSYRTMGGHRRLAAEDVDRLARGGSRSLREQPTVALLDDEAVSAIERALHGDLSAGECRFQLRTLGRRAGVSAQQSGQTTADTITTHLPIRGVISDLVARVRTTAGIVRSEVDEREWSDSLADAFILGVAESADPIRVRGGDRQGGARAGFSHRGPPQ